MYNVRKIIFLLTIWVLFVQTSKAQIDIDYQVPDQAIAQLADAPPPPLVYRDNKAEWLIMLYRPAFKSIEEVASREYRLAGLRINPRNNGQSRTRFYNKITILNVKSGSETEVKGLLEKPLISNFSWSPDFKKIAFTISDETGISLWYSEVATGQATRLTDPVLNDVFYGDPYIWTPDSEGFVCKFLDNSMGPLISEDQIPTGPVVQQNLGKKAPARTYQDLLKNKDDEKNFTYLTSSELKKINLAGGISPFRPTGIYTDLSYSPDGKYLMENSIHRPYSYLVPYYRFPRKTIILDNEGKEIKVLNEAPLEEERPKGFMATSKEPRNFAWRADEPSTVYWVQALDEGDPKIEAEFRDAVFMLKAPFSGEASELIKLKQRFRRILWGTADLAVIEDYWWNTRNRKVYQFNPGAPLEDSKLIFDINTEDQYHLPGSFALELNKYGQDVLLRSKNNRTLYLTGEGYSPEGNKPFVDAFDVKTGGAQRIWQADGLKTYERVIEILNINKGDILTRIESPTENPNYFIRNIYKKTPPVQITKFPNPYKSLKGVTKEMLHYKRDDGTDLTAVLYLPAGYDKSKDGRLPVLLWAYPREFKDAKAAGQVKDSPHRFIQFNYGSAIFWVNRGYAVLDRTDFPIIGEGEVEPNDTFVEQLVANGKAAVENLDAMGVADPNRVGVGGHSYGAFMTANLLAHSDVFAAGIARSGAYNRTLTPFGFQAEERTFWEAPELYFKMSPFMHANDINEPILLIHGSADNNSGTFPMQSERMYNAIKGHGGTVRLVMLPNESHGYAARESVMHMLWEMDTWLETYVKNKKPMEETRIDMNR